MPSTSKVGSTVSSTTMVSVIVVERLLPPVSVTVYVTVYVPSPGCVPSMRDSSSMNDVVV